MSVWGRLWEAWRCRLLWVCDFIELQAGPGPALVLGFQGENVYIFFQLPRIEVKWSSLFCLTILLEPTNSRVAFVILRNDRSPPLIFFLGVFDFLFLLEDCYLSFLWYYLEKIQHIFPFRWNFVCLFSVESERKGERKIYWQGDYYNW